MALAEEKNQVVEKEQPKYRYRVRPRYTAWNEGDKVHIRIALPGVNREDIEMKALKDLFMLRAKRDHILYTLDINLYDEIIPDKSEAKYNEGLLEIEFTRYNPLEDAFEIKL